MIEVIDCEQNSEQWHQARVAVPTASMFHAIMAKGEGKTRNTYMLKLAGEVLTGEPADSYSNHHMERGHAMEPDAVAKYAFMCDVEPVPVGFIRNGRVGCSPDRLVGDAGMAEFKTALPHIQIDLLLRDRMPNHHMAQVQGEMWIAEREWNDFVSYWPKLPLFVKRVPRDEEYIKRLSGEVDRFLADLDAIVTKINGTSMPDLEAQLRASLK